MDKSIEIIPGNIFSVGNNFAIVKVIKIHGQELEVLAHNDKNYIINKDLLKEVKITPTFLELIGALKFPSNNQLYEFKNIKIRENFAKITVTEKGDFAESSPIEIQREYQLFELFIPNQTKSILCMNYKMH